MNGGTEGEGESFYVVELMKSEPAVIKRKEHKCGNAVTFLVDSHSFGDIIPDLKHRLQNYSSPRTILTAEGALLDGTTECVLQGLVTDDYGEQQLARIAILIVRYLAQFYLSKNSSEEGHRFDSRCRQTQAEDGRHHRATSRTERRSLLLQETPQCRWKRRKLNGDECGD